MLTDSWVVFVNKAKRKLNYQKPKICHKVYIKPDYIYRFYIVSKGPVSGAIPVVGPMKIHDVW